MTVRREHRHRLWAQLHCRAPAAVYTASLTFLIVAAGCRHYRAVRSSSLPIRTIAVGSVVNQTIEPALGTYVRNIMTEVLTLEGSFDVVPAVSADAVLAITILSETMDGIAEARQASSSDALDRYRPNVFTTSVFLEYRVLAPGQEAPLIATARVEGMAEFSELVDMEIVKQDALRRATAGACRKIVDQLVIGW